MIFLIKDLLTAFFHIFLLRFLRILCRLQKYYYDYTFQLLYLKVKLQHIL